MNTTIHPTAMASPEPDNSKRRQRMFGLFGAAIIAIGGGYGAYWYLHASHYVSTDNAYVAADIAVVTAEVSGPVAVVRVTDTQLVRKGDVLVEIDPTDARLALRHAEAEHARAEAQVVAAKADAERTAIDLQRRATLAGSGAISGDELTHVKNRHNSALAALEATLAAREAAVAQWEKAQIDLARTTIRSPIDGVVARRQVQLGQRVQPSMPLLSVVPIREVYVNANFKEGQLKEVRPGQAVELFSDLYGSDVVFRGVVDDFSAGTGAAFALIPAQNATGNWIKVVQRLPVRVRLDPQQLEMHPLRVGLSMTAKVDLRSKS